MKARFERGPARLVLAKSLVWTVPLPAQELIPPDSVVQTMLNDAVRTGRTTGVALGLMDADGSRRVLVAGDGGPGALSLQLERRRLSN